MVKVFSQLKNRDAGLGRYMQPGCLLPLKKSCDFPSLPRDGFVVIVSGPQPLHRHHLLNPCPLWSLSSSIFINISRFLFFLGFWRPRPLRLAPRSSALAGNLVCYYMVTLMKNYGQKLSIVVAKSFFSPPPPPPPPPPPGGGGGRKEKKPPPHGRKSKKTPPPPGGGKTQQEGRKKGC